ncbi:MAG: helix-turn-helix transcriptional regulator [Marmoricola sp.]
MVTTRERRSSRDELLAVLRTAASPLSIAEIARQLGVHPNTARFHLDVLVANQQVERAQGTRSGPGRPALMFRACPGMDPTGPRNYQLLASVLVQSLAEGPDPSARAVQAGRAWGRQLIGACPDSPEPTREEAVVRLVRLLDDLGFAPEPVSPGAEGAEGAEANVGLRHCPFLELVESQAQVICSVHLGLMQGALAQLGAPVTAGRLDAFVQPDLCLATLTGAEPAAAGSGLP